MTFSTDNGDIVEAFFIDDDVRWLIARAKENRALKIAFPREIHISNLIGWLLAPNEGHGLGDLAIKELLLKAWQAAKDQDKVPASIDQFKPTGITSASFGNSVVLREYHMPEGRIDLIVIDQTQRLVIGIENKYGAKEGPAQLKRYADALERKLKAKAGWRLIMVLLDYDVETVPADARWIKLDYGWLISLVRMQLELGLLSDESTQTLSQFVEHLEDEDLVPYPRLNDAEATRRALTVTHAHQAVVEHMRTLSEKMTPGESVSELLADKPDPLAFEYIRHRHLWDHVLLTGRRGDVLIPVENAFPDVDFDFESSRSKSFFTRKKWLACWNSEGDIDGETHWPVYALVRAIPSTGQYRVAADFFPQQVRPALVDNLRACALRLRKSNGMSDRGVNKATAKRIRLAQFDVPTKEAAINHLISVMKGIDIAMFET